MALAYRTPGFVLSYRPVREHDRLYQVLTPGRGKLELLARGSRKVTSKLAGSLEPGRLLAVEAVSGRQFDHLTGAERLVDFAALREDTAARLVALGLSAFVDAALRPGAPEPRLFALLHELYAAAALPRDAQGALLLRDAFLWKCADVLGVAPDLSRCIRCASPDPDAVLCGSLGGALCGRCAAPPDAVSISRPVLGLLRAAHALPLAAVAAHAAAPTEARIAHRAAGAYLLFQLSAGMSPHVLMRLFSDIRPQR